ncbi:thiol-disulfide oxidoreductase DCC family protein [Halorientalis pallida]|uniref:thiol-disulfide oxidoreductase DCC family protein n=1 Tax=Halorientalis pallida TaxID=2479928 RepID=UPI003C705A4F
MSGDADRTGDTAGGGSDDDARDPAEIADEIQRPVLLFDGVCNLCNRSLRLLVKFDHAGRFRFAPLQSPVGKELLTRHGLDSDYFDSIVLIDGDDYYTKSEAALRVCRELDGPLPLLYALMAVPEGVRDRVYDFVGDHRYQVFGRKEACPVPDEELRQRFLERSLD